MRTTVGELDQTIAAPISYPPTLLNYYIRIDLNIFRQEQIWHLGFIISEHNKFLRVQHAGNSVAGGGGGG